MRWLTEESIEHIALGAAVLGTGGGGDPYLGKLMALEAIKTYGPIKLLSIEELADDALIVPLSMMGSPTIGVEKIPSIEELVAPLEKIEETLGQKAAALMPIEVGGVNSLVPVLAAAAKGLPLVDADAMGRAFPESQMVTFYLDGHSADPTVLADEKGNTVVITPKDGHWGEKLARAITVQMGGSSTVCDYALPGSVVKKSAIPGTLTKSEEIGRLLLHKSGDGTHPIKRLLAVLNGYELLTGKLTDIQRTLTGGFTRGICEVEGIHDDAGRMVTLHFQNEQLLATEGEKPLAITPDLIAILDVETGQPITTEGLRYGMRVTVIAFPCDPKWRTKKGIETAGPRYFGYPVEYEPVEKLQEGGGK
ncbi:DUF917 domain-containing protein [Shouchella clausii]|uniref:DUF917 domain-containing protein n=2 Tax=Shouchella clausii TaxID=79880 RepID=Q5WCR3_SHOC1|nr:MULTISPECIES: DUF917 domain-containing protein [Shouchella]ALA53792.1 hypothetical protein DB29_02964 [Shouchella clausii]KKI87070.1 hypothetical protein WZ76_07360 [Shouchella clausii]MBU3229643.1 DUF917 domain-containing protein [Shouchella clausii]MBU3264273.1 DUF917 domain-containing protein [Shouchella clausii]MBU3506544.1 DUF917 domain-containing protein [Shouchella clausii]